MGKGATKHEVKPPRTLTTGQSAALAALAEFREQVWAMRPSALRTLWAGVMSVAAGELDEAELTAFAQLPSARATGGSVGVIPIRGTITRRSSFFSMFFGGSSTEDISLSLKAALADPSIDRIVLDFDSPGGTTDGVPELAAEIYAARAKKPITAYVDTVAASAAYWLAAQASEIVVTPSSKVGSIGVFTLHLDQSKLLADIGITPTFIFAGKYKVEGNPLEPLSEEARAALQERVDDFYGMFVRDVARGRGVGVDVVRKDYGEGRVVLAPDAVKSGMADRIGSSLAQPAARVADRLTSADIAMEDQLDRELGLLKLKVA